MCQRIRWGEGMGLGVDQNEEDSGERRVETSGSILEENWSTEDEASEGQETLTSKPVRSQQSAPSLVKHASF